MNNKNIITQTNRTILFEEINPEKPDLLTLIDEVKDMDSLSDERIIEINKYLLVSDFDDFLKNLNRKFTVITIQLHKV